MPANEADRNAPMLPRSQLRRLARDYYAGELDEADYHRRRRTLIDGISDGDVAIEREAPAAPPAPVSPEPPPAAVASGRPARPHASPVHAAVGVAVVAAIAIVVWLAWPAGNPAPDGTGEAPRAAAPRIPPRAVSPARTLVESFLAARDWSEGSVAAFDGRWSSLPEAERESARATSWFRRLTTAARDELKTQRALAEFDPSGAATATADRLAAFRERLGVGNTEPARTDPVPPAAQVAEPVVAPAVTPAPAADVAPALAAAPPATAPAPPPTPPSKATDPAAPARSAAATGGAGREPVGGSAWAAAQPPTAYTLQLFALNRLDRIERLMSTHPSIEFRIVVTDEATPHYRVLLGSYANQAQARAAHAELPAEVRAVQPQPLVKSFAELRGQPPATRAAPGTENRARAKAASTTALAAPTAGDWLDRAGRDRFTLQLFVSERRESVEQLVAENPGLGLQIIHTREQRSLYRILHGIYPSAAAASGASARLPASLLEDTGKPLVKSVAEMQDARGG